MWDSYLEVVPPERVSFQCTANENGRLRVQPHRLVDDAHRELEVLDVLDPRRAVPEHAINLARRKTKQSQIKGLVKSLCNALLGRERLEQTD